MTTTAQAPDRSASGERPTILQRLRGSRGTCDNPLSAPPFSSIPPLSDTAFRSSAYVATGPRDGSTKPKRVELDLYSVLPSLVSGPASGSDASFSSPVCMTAILKPNFSAIVDGTFKSATAVDGGVSIEVEDGPATGIPRFTLSVPNVTTLSIDPISGAGKPVSGAKELADGLTSACSGKSILGIVLFHRSFGASELVILVDSGAISIKSIGKIELS